MFFFLQKKKYLFSNNFELLIVCFNNFLGKALLFFVKLIFVELRLLAPNVTQNLKFQVNIGARTQKTQKHFSSCLITSLTTVTLGCPLLVNICVMMILKISPSKHVLQLYM